ncbi:MAG: hypothetical protein EXS36_19060 [Pedosphaera sp.]|nr:hypothetical protein [Pedosphaera sp.]
MITLTFKLPDADARRLREKARLKRITLSEFLRRQLLGGEPPTPIRRRQCQHTGAEIFGPAPHLPPLTTESVREVLSEFP